MDNARDSDRLAFRKAEQDRHLSATIVDRRPLRYRVKASAALDRPAHVRAGSSLTWVGARLGLVQDDANFVALVDPKSSLARAISLPAGEEGKRLFDDARGNKKFKLDLEACCTIEGSSGTLFLALGSGSKKRRRRIITIEAIASRKPRVSLIDAESLYVGLEEVAEFAGSDMNIEGALAVDGALRVYSRGNGEAKGGRLPLNASADIAIEHLLAYLHDAANAPMPPLRSVTQYQLGELGGLALGFTDATLAGDVLLYTAAAEASKGASEDGRVSGSAIGVIPPTGNLRYAPLRDEHGRESRDKVEGIVAIPMSGDMVYIVVDPDDHTRPSELCRVQLSGSWR